MTAHPFDRRTRRLRRWLWALRGLATAGAAVAVLALALLLASTGWILTWRGRVPLLIPDLTINVNRGMLWATNLGSFSSPGFDAIRLPRATQPPTPATPAPPQLRWWPTTWWKSVPQPPRGLSIMVEVPLWLIGLLGAGTSAGTWLAARRVGKRLATFKSLAPTCRRCGYARQGLQPDTACPECGAEQQ